MKKLIAGLTAALMLFAGVAFAKPGDNVSQFREYTVTNYVEVHNPDTGKVEAYHYLTYGDADRWIMANRMFSLTGEMFYAVRSDANKWFLVWKIGPFAMLAGVLDDAKMQSFLPGYANLPGFAKDKVKIIILGGPYYSLTDSFARKYLHEKYDYYTGKRFPEQNPQVNSACAFIFDEGYEDAAFMKRIINTMAKRAYEEGQNGR